MQIIENLIGTLFAIVIVWQGRNAFLMMTGQKEIVRPVPVSKGLAIFALILIGIPIFIGLLFLVVL